MGFFDIPAIGFTTGTSRKIDVIQGFITLSESTNDTLQITKHPVQQGATITDHSFIMPTSLSMNIQFKPSLTDDLLTGGISGAIGGVLGAASNALGDVFGVTGGSAGPLAKAYKKLLELQASRLPFKITTPKRIYNSMLIASLGLTTDKRTENVLSISATFEEIIIVQVTTTNVPRIRQKKPQKTAKTEKTGNKSVIVTGVDGIRALRGG